MLNVFVLFYTRSVSLYDSVEKNASISIKIGTMVNLHEAKHLNVHISHWIHVC